MGTFQYIARTAGGDEVTGAMQGDNEAAVVRALDERELFPVRVTPQAQRRGEALRRRRVRPSEVGVVYGQLGDLLRAGVPMMKSLETLAKAAPNRQLAQLILSVRNDVSEGKTLADALLAHPRVFRPLHGAMVRAGERGGFLEDVLSNLSGFIERQDDLRSKVRGAMIYPVVLVTIGTVVLAGILIFLVPKFQGFFRNIPNVGLPLPTQILFAVSDLLAKRIWVGLIVAAAAVYALRALVRSQRGRRVWDRWRLKVPVYGGMIQMLNVSRFCRILGTMLGNGVPILAALAISKDAADSIQLADGIEVARDNVQAGEPLAEPLRATGIFSPEIIEMIAIAEESNRLEDVLIHIADTVERRANRQVDMAVRLLEPCILVVLAAVVGFVAVGLVYPIFKMSEAMAG